MSRCRYPKTLQKVASLFEQLRRLVKRGIDGFNFYWVAMKVETGHLDLGVYEQRSRLKKLGNLDR